MLSLLFNSELIGDASLKFSHSREDEPGNRSVRLLNLFHFLPLENIGSVVTYYFPSVFHLFLTMSKRTWSTENEVYKKFKWIPFKIDSVPWNGLLKRHLWRRMIDT